MTSQTDRATFTATEEEEQLATQVLIIKNCHTTGILNTDAAIDIFKRSGLPDEMLSDIWTLSDKNRSGDFSRDELTVAFRYMGWVQAGETLHEGLLVKRTFYYCSKDVRGPVDRSCCRGPAAHPGRYIGCGQAVCGCPASSTTNPSHQTRRGAEIQENIRSCWSC
jgi:hypothetical protein